MQRFLTRSPLDNLYYPNFHESNAIVVNETHTRGMRRYESFLENPNLPNHLKVIAMMLPIFPLLFLITSIGSVVWYQRTGNDIFGVLAFASALACVIWGLVISHWLIHILSLIILLRFRTPILSVIQVKVDSK